MVRFIRGNLSSSLFAVFIGLIFSAKICLATELKSEVQNDSLDNDLSEIKKSRQLAVPKTSFVTDSLQWLSKIIEHPRTKRLVAASQSAEVSSSMKSIEDSPYHREGLIAEVVFMFLMVLLRWRMVLRSRTFLRRVGVKLVCFVISLLGIAAIAVGVYGQPLVTLFSTFARAL